jgi:hypothetical protein
MTEVGSQFLKGKIVIKLRFTFFVFVTLFIALAKENKLGNFLFPAEVGESGAKLIESAPTASVWHIHQNGEDAYEIPNEANFENLSKFKPKSDT